MHSDMRLFSPKTKNLDILNSFVFFCQNVIKCTFHRIGRLFKMNPNFEKEIRGIYRNLKANTFCFIEKNILAILFTVTCGLLIKIHMPIFVNFILYKSHGVSDEIIIPIIKPERIYSEGLHKIDNNNNDDMIHYVTDIKLKDEIENAEGGDSISEEFIQNQVNQSKIFILNGFIDILFDEYAFDVDEPFVIKDNNNKIKEVEKK